MGRSMAGRLGYVALGVTVGLALAIYGLGLRPPTALAGIMSVKCATPKAKPKPRPTHTVPSRVVVDPATGMSVQASNLHQDNGGDTPPPAGDAFLVVHVFIYNGGSSAQDYNPLDFHLHGQIDQTDYDSDALDINVSPTLDYGTLAPGHSIAGDIVFQVPDNGQGYTLTWTPQFGSPALTVPITP